MVILISPIVHSLVTCEPNAEIHMYIRHISSFIDTCHMYTIFDTYICNCAKVLDRLHHTPFEVCLLFKWLWPRIKFHVFTRRNKNPAQIVSVQTRKHSHIPQTKINKAKYCVERIFSGPRAFQLFSANIFAGLMLFDKNISAHTVWLVTKCTHVRQEYCCVRWLMVVLSAMPRINENNKRSPRDRRYFRTIKPRF